MGEEIHRADCKGQGSTPPELDISFLGWKLLEEEIMVLTFRDYSDPARRDREIERLVVHEAIHFWLNQTDRRFELDPEERYAKAITDSIWGHGHLAGNVDVSPAFVFEPTSDQEPPREPSRISEFVKGVLRAAESQD